MAIIFLWELGRGTGPFFSTFSFFNLHFVLVWSHTLRCSGAIPVSTLRNYSWQTLGITWDARDGIRVNHMQNLDQPNLLYYLSGPNYDHLEIPRKSTKFPSDNQCDQFPVHNSSPEGLCHIISSAICHLQHCPPFSNTPCPSDPTVGTKNITMMEPGQARD